MAGALSALPTARLAALRARLSDDELRNFPTTAELLRQIRDALEAPDAVALLDTAALRSARGRKETSTYHPESNGLTQAS